MSLLTWVNRVVVYGMLLVVTAAFAAVYRQYRDRFGGDSGPEVSTP